MTIQFSYWFLLYVFHYYGECLLYYWPSRTYTLVVPVQDLIIFDQQSSSHFQIDQQSKNSTGSATSCSLNLSASYLCSGQNKVFLIDWLFKWTLRRASNALVYSWASGGHCKPTSGSRSKPWWGSGVIPLGIFSTYT